MIGLAKGEPALQLALAHTAALTYVLNSLLNHLRTLLAAAKRALPSCSLGYLCCRASSLLTLIQN